MRYLSTFSACAQKGVSALEYATLLGIIAVGVTAALGFLGGDINAEVTKVSNDIAGIISDDSSDSTSGGGTEE